MLIINGAYNNEAETWTDVWTNCTIIAKKSKFDVIILLTLDSIKGLIYSTLDKKLYQIYLQKLVF